MDYKEDFYMVLTSNLFNSEYPDNKPSHFITPLARPLELDKESWRCGLSEITFPHSWSNIDGIQCDIQLYKNLKTQPNTYDKITIPSGFYRRAAEICIKLNNLININISKKQTHASFEYNPQNDTVKIQVNENRKLIINKQLSMKLGFDINIFTSGIYIANRSADIHYDTHHFFVYSNVINEIPVGNSYVKLLRTVPTLEDSNERYITKIFDKPHYMNIASSFENVIEIGITTDEGTYFNFRSGKVIITLHFIKTK